MSALPPIDDRALPADLRGASREDKTRFKAALAFERQLVEQLAQQLSATAEGSDDGDDKQASAATDTYKQMLPGVLADSITQAGGLGLARTIADSLKEAGR